MHRRFPERKMGKRKRKGLHSVLAVIIGHSGSQCHLRHIKQRSYCPDLSPGQRARSIVIVVGISLSFSYCVDLHGASDLNTVMSVFCMSSRSPFKELLTQTSLKETDLI